MRQSLELQCSVRDHYVLVKNLFLCPPVLTCLCGCKWSSRSASLQFLLWHYFFYNTEQPQQKDELDVYPVLEEIQEDPGNEPSDVQQADDEPELNATSMADEFQNYADSLEQDATAHGKIRQCRYRMVKKRVCQHAGKPGE